MGHVAVALRDGSCRIDWGDGRTSSLQSRINDESMIYADHIYPRGCKTSSDIFEISITSDNDSLIGFYSGCFDMLIDNRRNLNHQTQGILLENKIGF